ncbi:hypothetical protein C5S32_09035 [ANME-1 cluster archaeon GoMg1]|nr:hypothetical protein [ANME-1 cluster archaeon GoMg1]
MNELSSVINHLVMITIFVFVMMLIIDYINVLTKGDMEKALKGGRSGQYAIVSFLGATPGCLGAFAIENARRAARNKRNMLANRLQIHI